MRDSSTALRTAYLNDGFVYGRLGGLGAAPAACRIPPGVLSQLGRDEQSIVVAEAANDQKFCRAVTALARTPGWTKTVNDMIRRVILNETNPKSHRETAGKWPILRARVRKLTKAATAVVEEQVSKMTPAQKVFEAKKLAETRKLYKFDNRGLGEAGVIPSSVGTTAPTSDPWATLIGSVVTAAGSVYGAKITADANEDIARRNTNLATQQLQFQQTMASLQQQPQQQQYQGQQQPAIYAASSLPFSSIGQAITQNMGSLLLPGLGMLALYFFFGRNKR